MASNLVASLLLVAMPGAPSSVLDPKYNVIQEKKQNQTSGGCHDRSTGKG